MPLETRARVAAERLLLLTDTLTDVALNGRIEEIGELFQSRQAVIDQLKTMDIDAAASALLQKTAEAERQLLTVLLRTQGEAASEMAALLAGTKSVRAYKSTAPTKRLLRTG